MIKILKKDNERLRRNNRIYKKKHPWVAHYNNAKSRCRHRISYIRKGIKVLMTQEEFKYLWFRDKAYFLKKPSIDRIDNFWHYHIDNCRFIEAKENFNKDVGCAVIGFKENSKKIIRYNTQTEAAKKTGVSQGNISFAIINGKKRGGYYWKRYEECNPLSVQRLYKTEER